MVWIFPLRFYNFNLYLCTPNLIIFKHDIARWPTNVHSFVTVFFSLCNLPFLITAAWASIWGMLMIVTFLFVSQLLYSLGDVTEQTIFRHSNEVVDRWNENFFSLVKRSPHWHSSWVVCDWIFCINFLYFSSPKIKLCLKRQKSKHDTVSLCDLSQIYEFQSWNVEQFLCSLCFEQMKNASERAIYRLHSPN